MLHINRYTSAVTHARLHTDRYTSTASHQSLRFKGGTPTLTSWWMRLDRCVYSWISTVTLQPVHIDRCASSVTHWPTAPRLTAEKVWTLIHQQHIPAQWPSHLDCSTSSVGHYKSTLPHWQRRNNRHNLTVAHHASPVTHHALCLARYTSVDTHRLLHFYRSTSTVSHRALHFDTCARRSLRFVGYKSTNTIESSHQRVHFDRFWPLYIDCFNLTMLHWLVRVDRNTLHIDRWTSPVTQ